MHYSDAAYVLAYSTIMLNTASYNPQVKDRMTKLDFLKMNRGINDGSDLPEDMLSAIYDDILKSEIRMKDEIEAAVAPTTGLANTIANVGRDLQKEAYVTQSTGMASKTEVCCKPLPESSYTEIITGSLQNSDAIPTKREPTIGPIHQCLSFRPREADV